ncbi:hypothetical protein BJY59DRAFT_694136 [Rhodotorula toruloides]
MYACLHASVRTTSWWKRLGRYPRSLLILLTLSRRAVQSRLALQLRDPRLSVSSVVFIIPQVVQPAHRRCGLRTRSRVVRSNQQTSTSRRRTTGGHCLLYRAPSPRVQDRLHGEQQGLAERDRQRESSFG